MSKFIKLLSILLINFALLINFYSVYASDINMNLASDTGILDQNVVGNNSSQTTSDNSIVNPSSIGATQEDVLSISNIINILLIAVGVVLILLAIAIIIRLK